MDFAELKGLTLTRVTGAEKGCDRITLETACGRSLIMYHRQDCCEAVAVEDVTGDVSDLIGTPLLEAEEVSSGGYDGVIVGGVRDDRFPIPDDPESWTWTFYKLGTVKGFVTIRWLGLSNGCYSEGVELEDSANLKDE